MAEVSESAQTQDGSAAVEDEKKCEGGSGEGVEATPHLLSTHDEEASSPVPDDAAKKEDAKGASPKSGKDEDELCQTLGIHAISADKEEDGGDAVGEDTQYEVVPNPEADQCDLSALRGTKAPAVTKDEGEGENEEDLQNLAELVPGLRGKSQHSDNGHDQQDTTTPKPAAAAAAASASKSPEINDSINLDALAGLEDIEVKQGGKPGMYDSIIAMNASTPVLPDTQPTIEPIDSMYSHRESDEDDDDDKKPSAVPTPQENEEIGIEADEDEDSKQPNRDPSTKSDSSSSSSSIAAHEQDHGLLNEDQNLGGFDEKDASSASSSDIAGDDDEHKITGHHHPSIPPNVDSRDGGYHNAPSSASLSTATQTHEVRMPMYLPTFKPATGCTNASDFIVRCFVARLRSGITVVKHGRSRWCKSRLRILHVHADGRSLSWKPAMGEPSSSKRPPKLDLSTCMEVRHAWSPDPLNPMFTGTPILRQKCEAANAHKSFALIFPKRTVDITAVTADQCKVLMEGFSALCFRLHVANLAGRGKKGNEKDGLRGDEEASTTASVTLTNTSNPMSPNGSGSAKGSKRGGLSSR